MNFTFATASRIIFGPGTVSQVGSLVAAMGHQACRDVRRDSAAPVLQALNAAHIGATVVCVFARADDGVGS